MMKIGVIPDSFQVPFKEAVVLSHEIGAQGIQPYVTRDEFCPECLSAQDRVDVLKFVRSNDLVFSAVCADFGMSFTNPVEAEIERTKSMMRLALDFDTHIITTHIGRVPDDENSEAYYNVVKTIETLGKYGDEIGCCFATETGPEMAIKLKGILDKADTKSAKVNLDPANFVMCAGQDPVEAVHILKDYIVHTHAKDGIKTGETTYEEKPLGHGNVPFPMYLKALKEEGYDGFLTIEREAGPTRMEDIKHAKKMLSDILAILY